MHLRSPRSVAALVSLLLLALTPESAAECQQSQPSVPWAAHPRMDQCFDTPQSFIRAVAGPDGVEDENIKVRAAAPLSDGSKWVVDTTATTNHAWYLLEPGGEKKLCLTLFVPMAAQVTLAQSGKGLTAESMTQASPGFPEKHVRFEKPAGARTFSPAACREVKTTKAGSSSSRNVPCAKLFD